MTFVTKGHERVKDNMYLPFLLFISVTANSTIPFFVSLQMRQQVSFADFMKSFFALVEFLSFCTFHLLVEHMVRSIGRTILHLKSQYYILQFLQLLMEMVLVFLFLGIQLYVV